MLTGLYFNDYKAFGEAQTVPLRRLTILIGKNNSGKTAVTRSVALWGELAHARPDAHSGLPLQVRGLPIAATTSDLVHNQMTHGRFSLGFEAEKEGGSRRLTFDLQNVSSLRAATAALFVEARVTDGSNQVTFKRSGDAGARSLWELMESPELSGTRSWAQEVFKDIFYLAAVRAPVEPIYPNKSYQADYLSGGATAPHLLASNPLVTEWVSSWYEKSLGVGPLRLERDANSFLLQVGKSNLAASGQGLQQVLPVITALSYMAVGGDEISTLVVEEPELHLHPAAQGALARALANVLLRSFDSQVIVETHSENLILGIRQMVAERLIDPADVQIVWFEPTEIGTEVRPIMVEEDGSVDFWPEGVFSENLEFVRAISRANRR
ncbi:MULTISPECIES: DUF3696 domain-containing protein [unclassified Curtobacterium]|uniref:AAA family ATPase n=1 Tax=unclassified Curtobacterium TaxID=257496 RepID=UPI000F494E68|nr:MULTISPECIES: DUF3696 domain-containing protein [unclassified Curtobacterium]ROQ07019.1 putative ATPase [Curtobacterium sp. PhB171]ROQ27945.1 putative ATPase [Curtobacterium sp. PhB170]ROS34875.1 putative ATPase [Curtobacterium sp. PhB131]ROS72758.1 putative ATPase [Curtobacterium sp. PhB141]